jgi:hypothetical protein
LLVDLDYRRDVGRAWQRFNVEIHNAADVKQMVGFVYTMLKKGGVQQVSGDLLLPTLRKDLLYVVGNMVGTRRLELLTSTVSNPSANLDELVPDGIDELEGQD